jgi:hypothetical protein
VLKQLKSFDFLVLLVAFLYGNIFSIQNSEFNWSFFLIFFIAFLLEFLNKLVYLLQKKKKFFYFSILINTMKRGFLLGFFLEAFKVGS